MYHNILFVPFYEHFLSNIYTSIYQQPFKHCGMSQKLVELQKHTSTLFSFKKFGLFRENLYLCPVDCKSIHTTLLKKKRHAHSCNLKTQEIFMIRTQEDSTAASTHIAWAVLYSPFCVPVFSYDRQITKRGIAVYAFFVYIWQKEEAENPITEQDII